MVHPSLREGLARVLPQALLVGRPVISYDVDGAREVVLPETGVLLRPRDLEGLTAAILGSPADPAGPRGDGPGRAAAVRRPVPPRDDDRPAPVTLRAAARPDRPRAGASSGRPVAGLAMTASVSRRVEGCAFSPLVRLNPSISSRVIDVQAESAAILLGLERA